MESNEGNTRLSVSLSFEDYMTERTSSLNERIKCALAYLCPDFIELKLDKLPLKICGIRRRLNFIQPGFEPPLNGIPIRIHLTTYRSGRLLLNEVKKTLT